jgi:hypothetical protein
MTRHQLKVGVNSFKKQPFETGHVFLRKQPGFDLELHVRIILKIKTVSRNKDKIVEKKTEASF